MKKHQTRRALLLSALSLLLCVSMLVGSTFAWFTDSVTSGRNMIAAGNLDVVLQYWDGDSYEEVTSDTKLFNDAALWEPGYTEVAYLKVSNAGSLALKYQLAVNVYNEILGKTKTGADITLSDHLQFKVVESDTDLAGTYASREAAQAAPATATKLQNYSSDVKPLDAKNEAGDNNFFDYVALIIYMPETVGNEANHNGVNIPAIEMGVSLLATQQTVENDSFDNQYDKDAGLPWNGEVSADMPETLVVDATTQTIHVKDAEALLYLSTLSDKWAELYTDGNGREYINYANGAGAAYYYSEKWTISLEANINLNNYPIKPINIMIGEATGATAFNGNNHVISNINTTTGLFADNSRANYANLTLVNVKATNGALTGCANSNITNVTVKNATISGTDYVGGLVGYIYGDVAGCEVVDSSVAGNKEVGGLIGYIASSSGSNKVTDNAVRNVSVSANNRAAGLVAQANTGVKVYGNTVDTVTVAAEDVSKYQPGAVISNALEPANVYDNIVKDCTVGIEVYGLTLIPNGENSKIIVNNKEGFLNLTKLFADWTALFTDGNGNEWINYANGAGADYYYGGYWTVELNADIDLNNATIAPITIHHPVSAGEVTFNGNNHTIKNAKIVADSAAENITGLFNVTNEAFKNLKLDNIHVTGSNVGNSNAGILAGYCSGRIDNITITNSSVTGGKYTGGVVGSGYTDISNCKLTNVTVKGGYKLGGIIGYICAETGHTHNVTGNTLTDCTVDGIGGGIFAGGKTEYVIGQVVGNYNCNGTCNNNTITGMTSSATDAIGKIEAGMTVTQ